VCARASSEKRAALSHFEPKGVLISHGSARADRRRFNDEVLESDRPVHQLAARFLRIVGEEAEQLLIEVRRRGELRWDEFVEAWFRAVRRIVLGDAAREDHALTDLLAQLRSDANWALLHPRRRRLRRRFFDRLREHLLRAEPGSLVGVMVGTPASSTTQPDQQVPQWLFAFDATAIATLRALALLAAHPAHAERVQEEISEHSATPRQELPYLRACVLESVRLWPTTPTILRQSTQPTSWEAGTLPAQTGLIIFAPFFHRDDQRLPYAHRFEPELWLDGRTAEHAALIPFSAGPAICPGRNLALLLSTAMLAALLADRDVRLKPPTRLDARRPLPGTLNNYSLRFTLAG